jgi:hypothetical protein
MKIIKQTIYMKQMHEIECKVTNVIHDLPTWMFPCAIFRDEKMLCPVCHGEMAKQIGHGEYIETCSMIQLDNYNTYPIHRECYDKLEESHEKL